MSKFLALLSGKGGSGKTSLALSIASVLSECGIKVLLMDCDLSTNGATYFLEDKLSKCEGTLTSFWGILSGKKNQDIIAVNNYFDFIPSILRITKRNIKTYSYSDGDEILLKEYINGVADEYDVILFDCQAGYSDVCKIILPIAEADLFVMEADAISSAAVRGLYLKIGELIEEKKVFQVFNKVTPDEYKIYSNVTGGTIFTNIETILFDWKIRDDFCLAKIPDMKYANEKYASKVFNICNIVFPENNVSNKLEKYKIIIDINSNLEQQNKLKKEKEVIKESHKNTVNSVELIDKMLLPVLMITSFGLLYDMVSNKVLWGKGANIIGFWLITAVIVELFSFSWYNLYKVMKRKKQYRNEINLCEENLEEIRKNIQQLRKKLNEMEQIMGHNGIK